MDKINIRFWQNVSKKNRKGESPILLRITVNGKRSNCATGFSIPTNLWDSVRQYAKGDSELAKTINASIDLTKAKIHKIQRDHTIADTVCSAESIRDALKVNNPEVNSLLSLFDSHNNRMYSLIGKDVTKGTYKQYLVTKKKIQIFLNSQYSLCDISLQKLSVKFISDFEHYLKTSDGNSQNTIAKHLKRLKKVIRFALINHWLLNDPFSGFRIRTIQTARGYLTNEELKILESQEFSTDRLAAVRDIFVFSCYTGLSYCDVQKLTLEHISLDEFGNKWIVVKRSKTGTESIVPVFCKADEILKRYQSNPECVNKGKLLPSRSNQKMNSYLSEIGRICGIRKKITCHLARHTFATTITLANGISTEVVGKMLGHTNIRTTQIYAKMTIGRIAAEMRQIKDKL